MSDDNSECDAAEFAPYENGGAPIPFAADVNGVGAPAGVESDGTPLPSPRLGAVLDSSILRAERRSEGREKPILLPWPVLADHFGGGLWPGVHFLNAGTGIGKTQFALQVALHGAKCGVPGLYIGLELGELDLALRLLGEEAQVPWSHLYTGKAGPELLARVRKARDSLDRLPFHYEVARPMGFSAAAIAGAISRMREAYPEEDGPGSKPLLVVVDFLQLVGDEPSDEQELRIRIARAAYSLRYAADRLNVVVLCISAVARERLKTLADIVNAAGLAWDEDEDGCPNPSADS